MYDVSNEPNSAVVDDMKVSIEIQKTEVEGCTSEHDERQS